MRVKEHAGSARLSPLEVRLEISKCASNIIFEFLERLKDRRSVVERYRAGDVHLHLHFIAGERMWCATLERHALNLGEVGIETGVDGNSGLASSNYEMPVFVCVGEVSEPSGPVASHIRLQRLHCCDMAGVDAFEEGCCASSLEIIFRVHNRKLRAALFSAGIQLGQLEDEIIQGTSEVVTNLAHQDPHAHPEECFRWPTEIYDAVRRIRIEIKRDGICLSPENASDFGIKLRKVFVCPPFSLEAAVKRVNSVIGHGLNPSGAARFGAGLPLQHTDRIGLPAGKSK